MPNEKIQKALEKSSEYWDEKVPVYIEEPLDGEGGSLPINVSVNGECISIARGKEIMVARKFAEVIENSKKSKRENRAFVRRHASTS